MSIIDELKKDRIHSDTTIKKLVEKIYEEVLKSIKFKNKNGITNMTYQIPPIFIGFPLYNIEEVTYKLNVFLKKKGFKTTMNSTIIYINW